MNINKILIKMKIKKVIINFQRIQSSSLARKDKKNDPNNLDKKLNRIKMFAKIRRISIKLIRNK